MNCVPNLFEINAEIVMNKSMTHSNNFSPRQYGMLQTKFL